MVLRRGSNFYLFYDHIIAGSHFMAVAPGFRTRARSFLWNRSLSLAFRSRLPGLDLPSCRSLRSGFAAAPRCRRGCLAKPCGLRRMSASLDFRFLRGLASRRRHSLNYSCRRGIVKRGGRKEDKTRSAESYGRAESRCWYSNKKFRIQWATTFFCCSRFFSWWVARRRHYHPAITMLRWNDGSGNPKRN